MFGYFLEQCFAVAIYLGIVALIFKAFPNEDFEDDADE